MHMGYPNTPTLMHPPRWGAPEFIELIVYMYYIDIGVCGGPSYIVPRPRDHAYQWPYFTLHEHAGHHST